MEKTILTEKDLSTFIEKNDVVLLDFFADWCGPCKAIAPTIDRIAAEYQGRVGVLKVNIDHHKSFMDPYNITSIPTLLILKKGEEKQRLVGAQDFTAISKALDEVLS